MKEVSGNTWVQKAVFLEPKALFSSAFTMWSRGWYLCMELRMIWKRRVPCWAPGPALGPWAALGGPWAAHLS